MTSKDNILNTEAETKQAEHLTEKFGIAYENLAELLEIFSSEQVAELLEDVGRSAGDNKGAAFAAMPAAARALHMVVPDKKRTASLLCWIADIARENTAEKYKHSAEEDAAELLQEAASASLD